MVSIGRDDDDDDLINLDHKLKEVLHSQPTTNN